MKHHRSRAYTVKLCSLALIGVVSACQTSSPSTVETTATPPRPRPTGTAASNLHPSVPPDTLQGVGIKVWHPWIGVEAGLLETQVAEFNQENEWGITARVRALSSYTELFNTVTEALPGGEAPHVVVALPEHPLSWDSGNYVVDLADYVHDPKYGMSTDVAGDFPEVFWNQDVIGGRRLGVPAQRSARFIIYNESWAEELGYADPPRNEKEFRQQACAANKSLRADDDPGNDGMGGWLVDVDPMSFLSWMTAFGGGLLDGSGYRFLSPKNLEALAFVKQMYDDGCAWFPQASAPASVEFATRGALFASAGLEEFSEQSRSMAEAQNADAWTVLTFPGPVQPGLVAYGSSFVVLKSSAEEQLASWLFVRWLLLPENQQRWIESTGLFPLQASTAEDLADYARSHPQWAAALEHVPDAQIQPQLASWRQVKVMIGDGFDAMFRMNTPAGRVAEILAIMDRTASDLNP